MKKVSGWILVVLVSACTSDRVIVDERYIDPELYEQDLAECRSYASQVPIGEEMAKGAAVGAAVGGLLGAVSGEHDGAGRGAGAGAVVGGTEKMLSASEEKALVVKRCMQGRGYDVLN